MRWSPLVPALVAAAGLLGCEDEVFYTTVTVEMMVPEGQAPLDGVAALRVRVVPEDGSEELVEVIDRPTGGWEGFDEGLGLGQLSLELARVVLEGVDAEGRVLSAGETIPVPFESGRSGRVAAFFQRLGTAGQAPSLTSPRAWPGATYLEGGGVLLVGGARATDEVWVYAVDVYEPIELASLPAARSAVTVMPLGAGDALVIGGDQPSDEALVYDPFDDRWAAISLPGEATTWPAPAASALPDGGVLALRGRELVRLTAGPPAAAASLGELEVVPEEATLSVLSEDLALLVGGGEVAAVAVDPGDGDLIEVSPPPLGARQGHGAAVLPSGELALGGGEGEEGPIEALELYHPGEDRWEVIAPSATAGGRIDATMTALRDGRVLLTGGLDAEGALLADAVVVDPVNGEVATIDLAGGRVGQGATALPTGTVAVIGGEGPDGDASASVELLRPPSR